MLVSIIVADKLLPSFSYKHFSPKPKSYKLYVDILLTF